VQGDLAGEQQLKRTPLHDWHRANGARMVEFGGWEMPLEYGTGTLAEHLACRRGVAMFDVSHLGSVRVTGPQAHAVLQLALSNDLAKIGPGRAQYTHLLAPDGSVQDDIIVWWVEEERYEVMPNASNTARVLAAVGGQDVTESRAVLAVQGPEARAAVAKVFPAAAGVAHFAVRRLDWRGCPVVVAGTGYTGEDGIECSVPAERAPALWAELVRAGVTPAGLGARDTLRLEAGLPLHGHELGPGITPLEAGLGWVVAWDKPGGFVGRDALVAQRHEGVRRRLRGVRGAGRQPLRAGYVVRSGDAAVGALTSGNFSPVLGCGVGMSFLPVEVEVGSGVEVVARGRELAATVARLPFVPKAAGVPKGGD